MKQLVCHLNEAKCVSVMSINTGVNSKINFIPIAGLRSYKAAIQMQSGMYHCRWMFRISRVFCIVNKIFKRGVLEELIGHWRTLQEIRTGQRARIPAGMRQEGESWICADIFIYNRSSKQWFLFIRSK